VYLHLGRQYHVLDLDLAGRRALLEPFDGDYFTQAKKDTMTYVERLHERRDALGVRLSFGEVVYEETVLGYQRKRLQDHEVIDFQTLDELPTIRFQTRALWYELDELIASGPFASDMLLGALHALEHGQIAVLPLIAMCDRWDIGGLSTNLHPQTAGPTIFIYDGHPGGVGITRRGYDEFERLAQDARRLIGECRCDHGCPSCVQSPKCGNLNEPLSKRGALELLARMAASGPATSRRARPRPSARSCSTPPSR
jgi:DEAD/DEAH box helicase domain-containing protein